MLWRDESKSMLRNLIDRMHKERYCDWKFEYFLVFVVINIMAWLGCLATIITLTLFFKQELAFQYVIYSACSAILGISAFAYIVTGKD